MDDGMTVTMKTRRPKKGRPPTRRPPKAADRSATARHAKQREHILRHAARLFAETGYAVTTMDVLSEVTEMNKASLYYYFGSKRDILFELSKMAIVDGVQRSLPATRMKSARDGIVHLVEAGIQNLTSHENESRIFQQEYPYFEQIFSPAQHAELIELQRRYMKVVYEVIQQGIDAGEFRSVNVRLAGGLLLSWINSALRFMQSVSKQEVTDTLIALIVPALAAGPPKA